MKGTISRRAPLLAVAALGLLTSGTTGCQTIQSKYVATPLDERGKAVPSDRTSGEIIVSGEEWEDLSSPLFGAVEVTFENPYTQWRHLRTTSVRFGSDAVDKAVYTPAGEDLWAWQQATLRRNAIRGGNERLALVAFGAVGVTTSLAGRGSAVGTAGHLLALASLGALLVTDATTPSTSAPTAGLFPGGHLLDGVISVPPGLFAKRWIVFYTPQPKMTGCLRSLQLGYQLDDGQIKYVRLPFRDQEARSEWQADTCRGAAQ